MNFAAKIQLAVLAAATIAAPWAMARERKAPQKLATPEDRTVAFHESRVAAHPDDADAWRMLADALVRRAEATANAADYDRGWRMLDRAEMLAPGDVRILRARAKLLLSRHRFREARALAEEQLRRTPEDTELLGVAGDGAVESGDLDAAEAHYRKLASLSQLLSSWARLAHVAELRGNLDAAASLLEKALEAGYRQGAPSATRTWVRAVLGEIELHRGRPVAAREQYLLGVKESPDHPLVLEHFAELEQAEGNLPAAETIYRRILERRADPKTQLRLAALLVARGERQEAARLRQAARETYQMAVASGNEGYLRPLAILELAAGNYSSAAVLAARDIAVRPTAESRALLETILDAAAAAGGAIDYGALRKAGSLAATQVSVSGTTAPRQ